MSNLSRQEITDAMAEYEMGHAVEDYCIAGVHVWPFLRIRGSFNLYTHPEANLARPPAGKPGQAGILRRLQSALSLYSSWMAARCDDARHESAPDQRGKEVVFLTHTAARSATIGGSYYDVFVDPLIVELHRRSLSILVWETAARNEYRVPRYRASAFISHRLDFASGRPRFRHSGFCGRGEPGWFTEYNDWLVSLGASSVQYRSVVLHVSVLLRYARLFERWLKRVQPKVIFVVCWYSRAPMALSLAASRLGIRTVDLQHGLQGPGHFAYASWKKAPEGGYELLPTHFWVWGERDADTLRSTSGQVIRPERVIIGGYPWLNLWRYEGGDTPAFGEFISEARRLCEGASHSILVTLQRDVPASDDFLRAIRDSPRDWRWLIRLHPGMMRKKGRVSSQLRETNHPNVEIERPTELPLYSILKVADVHVTWWSTCALEALAFGLPTVLLHRNGKEAFAEFIERGEMSFAGTKDELLSQIAASRGGRCSRSAETIFAGKAATDDALEKLLSGR